MSAKLSQKQLLFVKEYLVTKNATQSAIRAGYSQKTAGAIGGENLKKPLIAQAIEDGMKKQVAKIEKRAEVLVMDKVRWMEEVQALSLSDITDLYAKNAEGKLSVSMQDLKDRGLGRLIKKVKVDKNGTIEFELHSKQHALELFAKARNWLTDNVAVTLKDEELTEEDFAAAFSSPENAAAALQLAKATSTHKPKEN